MKTIAEQINEVQQYFIKKIETGDVEIKLKGDYDVTLIIDGYEFTYSYKWYFRAWGDINFTVPSPLDEQFKLTCEEAIRVQKREIMLKQIEQLQNELQKIVS